MTAGQDFVRKIKPLGCALFLLLFAGFLIMCFTADGAPVKGYAVPHDSEYYSEHIDELKTELETNLFPALEGIEDCHVAGDKLVITIDSEHYEDSSKAILHYYTENLFSIEKS